MFLKEILERPIPRWNRPFSFLGYQLPSKDLNPWRVGANKFGKRDFIYKPKY